MTRRPPLPPQMGEDIDPRRPIDAADLPAGAPSDADLTAMLDALAGQVQAPSADFMARAEAQALAIQPRPALGLTPRPAPRRASGWLAEALRGIGGWKAGAALAGSAMAGMAVGYLDPLALDLLYVGSETLAQGLGDPLADLVTEAGI